MTRGDDDLICGLCRPPCMPRGSIILYVKLMDSSSWLGGAVLSTNVNCLAPDRRLDLHTMGSRLVRRVSY